MSREHIGIDGSVIVTNDRGDVVGRKSWIPTSRGHMTIGVEPDGTITANIHEDLRRREQSTGQAGAAETEGAPDDGLPTRTDL